MTFLVVMFLVGIIGVLLAFDLERTWKDEDDDY